MNIQDMGKTQKRKGGRIVTAQIVPHRRTSPKKSMALVMLDGPLPQCQLEREPKIPWVCPDFHEGVQP